jgi:thymidylate synthase (FAD)
MTKQAPALAQAKQELLDKNIPFIEIGKHGYVALIGHYGSDDHICSVTRITSSSKGKDNESLIRYLMRNRHTTPFEFSLLEFEVALPIPVERQWIRHRTSATQEVSARYSQLPGEVFELPLDRIVKAPNGNNNRQGSGESFSDADKPLFVQLYESITEKAVDIYNEFCDYGLAPEIARMVLPLATYTRKRWKCDLHNLLHFLGLRMDPHAQKEIRDYADAVAFYTKQLFPITYKAFEDYRLNAITFSDNELNILMDRLASETNNIILNLEDYPQDFDEYNLGKTEMIEFKKKLERIVNGRE